MKPIKLAFLWHQHQPYYRRENEFILPWVRFHAVKDYHDLLILLDEFPTIKQSFNIVPSLLLQLNEYISGEVRDRVQTLSEKHPSELTLDEKKEILNQFFVCNFDNLIKPYPRYLELYHRALNFDMALEKFSEQDWLDLQVWYNLTWIGNINRTKSLFQRYFKKGSNFSQEEKLILLSSQIRLISEIIPTLQRLYDLHQIEVSISPFFHPILPLLIDSSIARESNQNLDFNITSFQYPEDARLQIQKGREYISQYLNMEIFGIWPSEGSLSTDVLILITEEGYSWTATDPKLLFKTLPELKQSSQYFPFLFSRQGKNLWLFFRDIALSDSIGFTYQKWDPEDAVSDFVSKVLNIRKQIINEFGEDYLELACVSVVLDGENCWEYYKDNGIPFLRKLYERIVNEPLIQTVTFSESLPSADNYPYKIDRLAPGSWINGNFDTWIGQPAKQIAWDWLAKVRNLLEKNKSDTKLYQDALELVMVAEGSDWFWWYGDDNIAPNKKDFDILFRWYLQKILETIGATVPVELKFPIEKAYRGKLFTPASKQINDSQFKHLSIAIGWGCYYARSEIASMHSSEELISEIYFSNSKKIFYIGFKLLRDITYNDRLFVYFHTPIEAKIEIQKDIYIASLDKTKSTGILIFKFLDEKILGISLDSIFGKKEQFEGGVIEFSVVSTSTQIEFHYPSEGFITHIVI